ncbi:MFS transporter [Sinomicrobium weinanense]|uniref:MFS transporter n=1 Tax=Sinomicrobium weinanense TaxID=2842200 RepID=A0A926Q1Q3_9FLAO|nr:MFS transporter [Sinomicrobium weinanense]MBC9795818.1 MFS transporter [Sinomicrobium weinanense]MBU3121862.1 MFS transporter [Sinomicrobium weinanense]
MRLLLSTRRLKGSHIPIATLLAYISITLSGFATDIYIPSMPHMARDIYTSESLIQLTLSVFLISYGVSQWIAGSVLDIFGRYRLNLLSLALFTLASFIISISSSIWVILLMRFIHGISISFIAVSKRSYFVDVFKGEEQKRYVSIITMVWAMAPILAPFIGGYLEEILNWRANFYFLTFLGFVLLLFELFFSGETIQHYTHPTFKSIWSTNKMILKEPSFLKGVIVCGISYGMVMFYGLSGTFILQHQMGYSAVIVGFASLILGLSWLAGGYWSKRNIEKDIEKRSKKVVVAQGAIVAIMICSSWIVTSIYTLIIFVFLLHMIAGYLFTNYFTRCVTMFPKNAGIAGGLTGGTTYIITSALSYGIAFLMNADDQIQLGIGYLILVILGFIVLASFKKR